MRAACLMAAMVSFAACPAEADSRWLRSGQLDAAAIGSHCQQVRDIRLLARMQMLSSGDARWRRLSRQELVLETALMGVPPLNPARCYVIARAGPVGAEERRAFEVYDFAVSTDRTSVLIVGRSYEAPAAVARSGR